MTNNTSEKSKLPLWFRIILSLIAGILVGCLALFLGLILSSEKEKYSDKQPIYVYVAIGLGIFTFFYLTVNEIINEVKPKAPVT